MTDERDEKTMLGMGSGNGFEFEESPPLRVTGYVCLLLGVLSVFSLLFKPMLLLALGSIVFGLIALRKHDGPRPAGTRVAMWGIVLSLGFGACGYTIPLMKQATLSRQAEEFASQYIELVALGHDEHAMDLKKEWYNRLSTDMNLADHYLSDPRISESLVQFKTAVVNREFKRRGPKAAWELDRPIRIYYQYGKDHAEVIWSDPTGESELTVQMIMDYRVDSKGRGQWLMNLVQPLRERLVADSVL